MRIVRALVLSIVSVASVALFSGQAHAATYYVSTTGDDRNPGTEVSPWRSVAYAAQTLAAGDTVYIRGGVYNEYVVIGRSGTSGAPIAYRAYPGENPIIEGGGPYGGIFAQSRTNLVFDGLTVRNTTAQGQGGGISIFDVQDPSGSITIQNCVLYNNNSGDNPAGVYITRSLGTINIRNNIIHDNNHLRLLPGIEHGNGVLVFGLIGSSAASNIIVANNRIHRQGVPVKYKHPTGVGGQFTVRNNVVYDVYGRAGIETVQQGSRIHNNVIYNVLSGAESPAIRIGADFDVNGVEVFNNSVYGASWGVYVQVGSTNSYIHDNVLYTLPASGIQGYGLFLGDTATTRSDYNLFYGGRAANWGGYGGGLSYSLADLQRQGLDTHSLTADPLYLAPPTDLHLQAASPARGRGSTGQDLGAYPTGAEAVGLVSGLTLPDPPRNLSVR